VTASNGAEPHLNADDLQGISMLHAFNMLAVIFANGDRIHKPSRFLSAFPCEGRTDASAAQLLSMLA
jgi:hypothetical protein